MNLVLLTINNHYARIYVNLLLKFKVMTLIFFINIGVKMRNIKLIIEYDGKGFNGWQKQPKYSSLNIFWFYFKVCQTLYITTFSIFNIF